MTGAATPSSLSARQREAKLWPANGLQARLLRNIYVIIVLAAKHDTSTTCWVILLTKTLSSGNRYVDFLNLSIIPDSACGIYGKE